MGPFVKPRKIPDHSGAVAESSTSCSVGTGDAGRTEYREGMRWIWRAVAPRGWARQGLAVRSPVAASGCPHNSRHCHQGSNHKQDNEWWGGKLVGESVAGLA